jgi:hypothetical protein
MQNDSDFAYPSDLARFVCDCWPGPPPALDGPDRTHLEPQIHEQAAAGAMSCCVRSTSPSRSAVALAPMPTTAVGSG